jgi:DNA-binding response OmpR family regulator
MFFSYGEGIMSKNTARILVVEDDPDIVCVVKSYLERSEFVVDTASDGLSGLARALEDPPALIVLDWMLPGIDGLEFMKRLRNEQQTPVIMLTARGEEDDRIKGLQLGADDYVPKPFSPRELVARIEAVLRRMQPPTEQEQEPLTRGPLVIDPSRHNVTRDDEPIELTTLEFNLLYTLARYPGRVYSRDELLERIWGGDFAGVDRVVDVHVSNLRQKLEREPTSPRLLLTVRGVGYKFSEDVT